MIVKDERNTGQIWKCLPRTAENSASYVRYRCKLTGGYQGIADDPQTAITLAARHAHENNNYPSIGKLRDAVDCAIQNGDL